MDSADITSFLVKVECPICNKVLAGSTNVRTLHVEECLNVDDSTRNELATTCIDSEQLKSPGERSRDSGHLYQSQETGLHVMTEADTEPSMAEVIETRATSCFEPDTDVSFVSDTITTKAVKSEREVEKFDDPVAPLLEDSVLILPDAVATSKREYEDAESQLGQLSKPRKYPFFKILSFGQTSFAVDAFCYGPMPVSAYFLSHYHSDHYGGLSGKWTYGPIYCTPVTARFVHKYLRVDPQYLCPVETNKPFSVGGVEVTFIDANHCPGSVIMNFNFEGVNTLHTGDFRASRHHVDYLRQQNMTPSTVYLDTTYMDSRYSFPGQDSVVKACGDYVVRLLQNEGKFTTKPQGIAQYFNISTKIQRTKPYKPLVLVGSYTIGKEKLAIHIAQRMGTSIFADSRKIAILRLIEDQTLSSLLNDDGYVSNVHVVPMSQLSFARLEEYFKQIRHKFTHLIAFQPTGWSFTAVAKESESELPVDNGCSEISSATLEKCKKQKGPITLLRVPYSEHSSYEELKWFCNELKPRRIVSTVGRYSQIKEELEQWQTD